MLLIPMERPSNLCPMDCRILWCMILLAIRTRACSLRPRKWGHIFLSQQIANGMKLEALSAPDQIYWSVEYVEALNIARFGSHGRGVWDYVICDQHAPALSADFTVFGNGPTYSFTNNAQGAHFNEWDFGDGNTTTATSPFHAYTRSGNYTVRLIASNYCSADTFTTKINWISASIADELEKQQFSLSPNPSQGKFTLTHIGNEHHKELTVRVISLQGNTVFRQTFAQFGTQQTLEFSTLPSGIYLVEVVDQETLGKEVLRWVKR